MNFIIFALNRQDILADHYVFQSFHLFFELNLILNFLQLILDHFIPILIMNLLFLRLGLMIKLFFLFNFQHLTIQ